MKITEYKPQPTTNFERALIITTARAFASGVNEDDINFDAIIDDAIKFTNEQLVDWAFTLVFVRDQSLFQRECETLEDVFKRAIGLTIEYDDVRFCDMLIFRGVELDINLYDECEWRRRAEVSRLKELREEEKRRKLAEADLKQRIEADNAERALFARLKAKYEPTEM